MTQNKTHFNAAFFKGNRAKLRARVQDSVPIVVTANGLLQRGADSGYAFAQDANFWYLTGIDDPDVTLVIDGEEEFLIVPARDMNRVTFDGSIDQDELAKRAGVTGVIDEAAGWKRLDTLLSSTKKVATPAAAPSYIQQYGMYANPSRARMIEHMKDHVSDLMVIDIRTDLAVLRMYKQPAELEALRRAITVTSETLNEIFDSKISYHNEYELEAEIFKGFRSRGAMGHSFEPIVASGRNACTLHNVANNDALRTGELIICDVGAEVEHYAADITRTFTFLEPSMRQQDVWTAVKEVQAYALSLLKPGVDMCTYEDEVAARMGKELKALKLIRQTEHDAIRKYFPHATSHFLGLNVHDVGDYTKPLEPNIVLTCEPGIYIPEEGIGVRIEDDVLITETGNEVLSADCRTELFAGTI